VDTTLHGPADPRAWTLVPERRLRALQARVVAALQVWCRDWGVDPAVIAVDAVRDEDASDVACDALAWTALGPHAWLAQASGFGAGSAALLFGPQADSAPGAGSIAADSLAEACETLRLAFCDGLDPGPAPTTSAVPPASRAGDGWIRLRLCEGVHRRPLLLVRAPASTWPSDAPAEAASATLPALRRADRDAALRGLPAQAQVTLGDTELPLSELLGLKPGDVIVLDGSIHEPLRLQCATQALPVHLGRRGDRFAVQLARSTSS
jgi:hypothetical protein